MSLPQTIDTRFRSALKRMVAADRMQTYDAPVDVKLEISAVLKKLDGQEAILFPKVKGFDMPVVGNFLSCRENCEAAFGTDYRGIRELIGRALGDPKAPKLVNHAPAQEVVKTENIDLLALLPALHHTENDPGRYLTSGIVIVKDPDTGVYNASYHRVQLLGGNRGAIKLDFGRHLRAAFDRAKAKGQSLPIAIAIGADIALHYTAATMGSQMPESADELAVAGGLAGAPLSVVKGITQDVLVPAESEIVLEGVIKTDEVINEGPFGEFVGSLSPEGDAPILEISAVTHRANPIYHAINGYGRETIMLRKYVLEASLLKVLSAAIPIVIDADMTAGGLHRFHAVIQVKKTTPQHEGLQRNAILAAFGALKDLDMVIAVDEDINLRDPADVEYALATRMEASKDLIVIPGARGHEYVRASNEGIRAKLGIDATVPLEQKARFARCEFAKVDIKPGTMALTKPSKLFD